MLSCVLEFNAPSFKPRSRPCAPGIGTDVGNINNATESQSRQVYIGRACTGEVHPGSECRYVDREEAYSMPFQLSSYFL